jgi:hypothetical protein
LQQAHIASQLPNEKCVSRVPMFYIANTIMNYLTQNSLKKNENAQLNKKNTITSKK